MSTSSPLLPVFAILISILVGIHYYDEMTNSDIIEKSSNNLKQWHAKGQFYQYKQLHNIFYVHEKVNDGNYDATLVLLHGFPTSSYDYSKIWHLLKQLKVKSILTFDFLGYGFSEKPTDYDYHLFDMADMVDDILVHLNILDNVHIISHDVGDSVLQELLRRDSNNENHFKIAKAAMLNGGIITDVFKPTVPEEMLRTKLVGQLFANHFFKFPFVKSSFSSVFGSLAKPNEDELYDFFLAIRYNDGQWVLPKTVDYIKQREQYGQLWYDALNQTSVPSLFIYGPADPVNPNDKFISKFKTDLPRVKLAVLSDTVGHYPQFEDPLAVYGIIKNFFSL